MALIIVLALLTAVTPFSVDMYMSAFPGMADEFGTSASMVQLTLTTFLVGLAVGQLFIGQLSDRLAFDPDRFNRHFESLESQVTKELLEGCQPGPDRYPAVR